MLKNKRGQITIFIILALFLVGGILLFFLIRGNLNSKGEISSEAEKVREYVYNCLEDNAKEIILKVGEGGGYYLPTNNSLITGVAIYKNKGDIFLPSKKEIEEEISNILEIKTFFCVQNFEEFENLGITQGEIDSKTNIKKDSLEISIRYPITVKQGESSYRFEDFEIKFNLRIEDIYNSINNYLEQEEESICLDCLLENSIENDFYIDMVDYDEETVIFIFNDKNSKIDNEFFKWVFAVKYDIE